MIATSHVIIGGAAGLAVGTFTNNAAAGLAAGIISHLLCDALPHLDGPINPEFIDGDHDKMVWTKGVYAFAITDSLLAFFTTLFLWYHYSQLYFWSPYAWGALGGYLPDFVDVFPLWRFQVRRIPGFRQFHALHKAIHDNWMGRFPMKQYWPLGIVTQLVTVLPCLWYLTRS
jgi:hypothetical protein